MGRRETSKSGCTKIAIMRVAVPTVFTGARMTRYIEPLDDAEILDRNPRALGRCTRGELRHRARTHARSNLYDESGVKADQIAIYSLSDPREIHDMRYIGQTRTPRSRFLQHVNAAQLWLPETLPWWIKSPQLRPLYAWIRALRS